MKNKNMNKKGQGAMEYLMTYGWAILVVLIVGIVLWQLGIFNLGGSSKTSTGFGAIKPLSWSLMGTGATITMTSGEGGSVTMSIPDPTGSAISNPSLVVDGKACTTITSVNGVTPAVNVSTIIPAGKEFQVVFADCTNGTLGTVYNAILSLSYTKQIGSLSENHTSTGNLRGPYE